MNEKKILEEVMKVGFDIGDARCPESFPFPACLASTLRYLGEEYSWKIMRINDIDFKLNMANVELLGASGMAFGLLWDEGYCPSCLDLTMVNDHDVTIDRAFKWAGYEYEVLEQSEVTFEIMRDKILSSIDNNIPVLAFGMVGPPECVIVTGYDNGGDVAIGWSYFGHECEKEENGQFRKLGWYFDTCKVIIIGDKVGRTTTGREALVYGLQIMESNASGNYIAGHDAYEKWMDFVLDDDMIVNMPDEELYRLHWLHQVIAGAHGEARGWGAHFLNSIAATEPEMAQGLESAAKCFVEISNAMWKLKSFTGDAQDISSLAKFRDISNRKNITELISIAQKENQKAIVYIKDVLRK